MTNARKLPSLLIPFAKQIVYYMSFFPSSTEDASFGELVCLLESTKAAIENSGGTVHMKATTAGTGGGGGAR